ncbi:MAG: hypothetical protein BroJett040_04130 [Oligoflexia bacterium]|nr:MAG: hypothetical protein BroJett040_04130 [Oligoflexia bacterium]
MRQSQQRAKIESQFLSITAVLVTLIGVPAFFSVMKDPTADVVRVYKVDSGRSPASIELAENKYSQVEVSDKVSTLTVDCESQMDEQEVSSALVRFTGKGCSQGKEFQVVNQTNGFTASIVPLKNNQYTTDFIDLKEGVNQIEVVSHAEDGQPQKRSFVIHRRQPASEAKVERQ